MNPSFLRSPLVPICLLGACAAPPPRSPQEPALQAPPAEVVIATDRPGFADSAGIVPKGRHQVEAGATFILRRDQGAETQRWSAPELLGRYGVSDAFELRVGWGGFSSARTTHGPGTSTDDGWADLVVGGKMLLQRQDEVLPTFAVEVVSGLGTGSAAVTNRELEPVFKAIAERDLGNGIGLFANANLALPRPDQQRYAQAQGAFGATFALQDTTALFVEYFVIAPPTRHDGPAHHLDGGVTHRLSNFLQVDASVGIGLSDEANDLFLGIGAAVLF